MWNARLDEAQAEIKTARRNINNLRYADDTTLMAESEKELKSLLMKVKEESEKAGLNSTDEKWNHGTWSHDFKANRWGNNGKWEALVWGGSKITADGDCTHEIKRPLLLRRKAMTNLSLLKSRDITLPTKVCLVKAMVFPVVLYGWESWTIKKAESWRTDAFELRFWGGLLRVPWTARRSKQSNQRKSTLNIHWQDWCWSWNTNTLAPWCEELIHWKWSWCWERLNAGEEGDDRGWGVWMASLIRWIWVWVSRLQELVIGREAWRAAVHGVAKSWIWLSDWTELNWDTLTSLLSLEYCSHSTAPGPLHKLSPLPGNMLAPEICLVSSLTPVKSLPKYHFSNETYCDHVI